MGLVFPFAFTPKIEKVKRDVRFGETLSVVENACRALWSIAQGDTVFIFTASYCDQEYLKKNLLNVEFCVSDIAVTQVARENFISPQAGARRRRKFPSIPESCEKVECFIT